MKQSRRNVTVSAKFDLGTQCNFEEPDSSSQSLEELFAKVQDQPSQMQELPSLMSNQNSQMPSQSNRSELNFYENNQVRSMDVQDNQTTEIKNKNLRRNVYRQISISLTTDQTPEKKSWKEMNKDINIPQIQDQLSGDDSTNYHSNFRDIANWSMQTNYHVKPREQLSEKNYMRKLNRKSQISHNPSYYQRKIGQNVVTFDLSRPSHILNEKKKSQMKKCSFVIPKTLDLNQSLRLPNISSKNDEQQKQVKDPAPISTPNQRYEQVKIQYQRAIKNYLAGCIQLRNEQQRNIMNIPSLRGEPQAPLQMIVNNRQVELANQSKAFPKVIPMKQIIYSYSNRQSRKLSLEVSRLSQTSNNIIFHDSKQDQRILDNQVQVYQ